MLLPRNYIPMRSTIFLSLFAIVFTVGLFKPNRTKAFAILAHEAIVDAEWEVNLKPMLLARYPGATPAQLKDAHAYAYGGCLMPDMGYMPFGDPYFTNLLHYVRSGDFVSELLNDAQSLNQYAFALGALSHYMADEYGPPIKQCLCYILICERNLATPSLMPITLPRIAELSLLMMCCKLPRGIMQPLLITTLSGSKLTVHC
jgi:hypothetical protein